MTNERARANKEPQPVSNQENESVMGHALCTDDVFQSHIMKVQKMRNRQSDYRNSLPADPLQAINTAFKLMHPEGEGYPDGFEEVTSLAFALEAFIKDGDIDHEGPRRDAALYIAHRMSAASRRVISQMDRISDVLGNPKGIERK